jgi:hypothetical protein
VTSYLQNALKTPNQLLLAYRGFLSSAESEQLLRQVQRLIIFLSVSGIFSQAASSALLLRQAMCQKGFSNAERRVLTQLEFLRNFMGGRLNDAAHTDCAKQVWDIVQPERS